MQLLIDGDGYRGTYRCVCDCMASWSGAGEQQLNGQYSPVMAVAECVVHVKACHFREPFNVDFSTRFNRWLFTFWERDQRGVAVDDRRRACLTSPAKAR